MNPMLAKYPWVFLAILGQILLSISLPRGMHGYLVLLQGLLDVICGGVILSFPNEAFANFGKKQKYLLAAIFIFWGLSEFGWALIYYVLNVGSRAPAVALITEFGYLLSFFSCIATLWISLNNRGRSFFQWKLCVVPLLVSTPVVMRLIIHPFSIHRDSQFFTVFNCTEIVGIGAAYVLVNLALLVMLSTRDLAWSIFNSGIVCLVFGDLGMRVDKILGEVHTYDAYSALALLGLCSMAIPVLGKGLKEKIDSFDSRSLFASYKFGTMLIVLFCLGFFVISERGSIESMKVICMGASLGSLIAVTISHFLTSKIQAFSTDFASVLKGEVEESTKIANVSRLPLELQENYELLFSRIVSDQKAREEKRRTDDLVHLQSQVAHDIRSPIAALTMEVQGLDSLPEDSRVLIRKSVNRINDIANLLVNPEAVYGAAVPSEAGPDKVVSEKREKVLMSDVIESMVTESRTQYRSRLQINIEADISERSYGLFCRVEEGQLKRVLSNLINNSVEALKDSGEIQVNLEPCDRMVRISIVDNGKGIPADQLERVCGKGVSFGKVGGRGLGLYLASTAVESWGGSLKVESKVDEGTRVTILLPRTAPPGWFVAELGLWEGCTVVIVDDDSSIHHIWDRRLEKLGPDRTKISVQHFSGGDQLREFCSSNSSWDRNLYLVDFDLRDRTETGLDLIQSMKLGRESILVTSRFDDGDIRRRCYELGVKVIPKGLAGIVPIRVLKNAYFLDDDPVIRETWKRAASKAGKRLITFSSEDELRSRLPWIGKESTLFIDYELNKERNGGQVCKDLFERGYKNLTLVTGHSPESLDHVSWVQGILGKECPWR